MIRLIFLLIVIILYFTFVLYNMEENIVLKYALGLSTQPLPVYFVVLGSIIVGLFLAGVLVIPGWIRMRVEMRRQRRTIEQMEQELNRLADMAPNRQKSDRVVSADEREES
jgi:uncharacterized membrane protein YciS (DUF1049 family)